ncbi:MAG: HAD family hydrolase [Dehalococcoidia bacterium]|nr:HAD family hydrolase [Dehalococcoidia bacterium]
MRIFVDIDNTLLASSESEWALRPGACEVLAALQGHGHAVYLWSATGRAHCQRIAEHFGLQPFITEYFDKDPDCPIKPDLIVDDDWYLVQKYSGVLVTPFREPDPNDRELYKVLAHVGIPIPTS